MYKKLCIVSCIFSLLVGVVGGGVTLTGGSSVSLVGPGMSAGQSVATDCGGDPSIALSISSSSTLNGTGTSADQHSGGLGVNITLGGYRISCGYGGIVNSSLNLNSGSGSVSSFIGASASGVSTGLGSYDLFGSADIKTEGSVAGQGVGSSYANGFANYGVSRLGSPSELWGQAAGTSQLRLEGLTPDSLVSTGGEGNGLHSDSRMTRTIDRTEDATCNSYLKTQVTVVNSALARAFASGVAQGGAWGPDFVGSKSKLGNEDVSASSSGELNGYAEADGQMDAAAASSLLKATVSRDSESLYISGGPASFATSTQTSSARRTNALAEINNSIWSSAGRTGVTNRTAIEEGNLSRIASSVQTNQAGSSTTTFGKIQLVTSYVLDAGSARSKGNMSLETFAEATNGTQSVASTIIGPSGRGFMASNDTNMTNSAGYVGGLFHYSLVNAADSAAETHNILTRAFIDVNPFGTAQALRPYNVSTSLNPNIAWSSTEGYYDQAHNIF